MRMSIEVISRRNSQPVYANRIVSSKNTAAEHSWLLSSMCLIVAVGLQVDEQRRRRRRRQANRSVTASDDVNLLFGSSESWSGGRLREREEIEDSTCKSKVLVEDAGADDVLPRDTGPAADSTTPSTAELDQADVWLARRSDQNPRERDSSGVPRRRRPWRRVLATVALLLLAGSNGRCHATSSGRMGELG